MCDQKTIEDIDSGKKKVVSKIEYLLMFWTPITSMLALLVAVIFWVSNADGRMFETVENRVEAERHLEEAKKTTIEKLDERYFKKEEVVDLKESIKELKQELKEFRKELQHK